MGRIRNYLVDTDIFIDCITNKEKKKIKDLIFRLRIIEFDSEIATKALEITHSYGTKPWDSIIAATAIVKKMMLITRNLKHFSIIPE